MDQLSHAGNAAAARRQGRFVRAGVYELAPGREAVITLNGDMLFVLGLGEPKLPLVAQSETQFMSTATPTGFEFVKDGQGQITHLIVRADDGDHKAIRRNASSKPLPPR